VDKREKGLQAEYRKKARDVYRLYWGVGDVQVGPVERRFGEIQGFVFGALAEASDDVHHLVKVMADNRLKTEILQSGVQRKKERLGVITPLIRRILSVGAVKRQIVSNRERDLGTSKHLDGRQAASIQDEKLRREAQAQWIGNVQGRHILRGFFICIYQFVFILRDFIRSVNFCIELSKEWLFCFALS